ncbi:MAG: hypothetical protein COU68_02860 [Candidatus Pacebacteria bacterium CG10_big_fil_rev_8_21_14_0_10_45_6]|nr:MAG: hypothetical protein COU68_02860 [Candidatus Pacebacteria bacterium CG10_big_fil_rev_8_21_14_0_10_45_6]
MNTSARNQTRKAKNPLYVVTKQGSVVVEARNSFDAFFKKYGLEPALKIFQEILNFLLAQVKSYPMLVSMNKFLQELLSAITQNAKTYFPFLFFYRA